LSRIKRGLATNEILACIIRGRVTEEQASPVAGNGLVPLSKVQGSKFNVQGERDLLFL
jgi:hypothetical protein